MSLGASISPRGSGICCACDGRLFSVGEFSGDSGIVVTVAQGGLACAMSGSREVSWRSPWL